MHRLASCPGLDPPEDVVLVEQPLTVSVKKMVKALLTNQGWKFKSCIHIVKNCVNLLSWLLIGCSLLCSQSGASLLVDTTLDNDYNS